MDDFDEMENNDNPFGASSRIETDGSLFDELGGDTGGRSFSMCPGSYKNVAKRLKKRALFLEAKLIEFKTQNKILLDEKAELSIKVEISEKDVKNVREQIDELNKTHDKEIRSIQNQTRAAFSELQLLKKNNVKIIDSKDLEIEKLKEKCTRLEQNIEDIKSNNRDEELIAQNVKWAKENNELRAENVKIVQETIDAKVHIANLASINDKLKHTLLEKSKEMNKLKSEYQKLSIQYGSAKNNK